MFFDDTWSSEFAFAVWGRINDSVKRRKEKINIIGCVCFEFFIGMQPPIKKQYPLFPVESKHFSQAWCFTDFRKLCAPPLHPPFQRTIRSISIRNQAFSSRWTFCWLQEEHLGTTHHWNCTANSIANFAPFTYNSAVQDGNQRWRLPVKMYKKRQSHLSASFTTVPGNPFLVAYFCIHDESSAKLRMPALFASPYRNSFWSLDHAS